MMACWFVWIHFSKDVFVWAVVAAAVVAAVAAAVAAAVVAAAL